MPDVADKVDRLDRVFASFVKETKEAMADIRTSNLRTDALLLEMQQRADRERQQAERDRKEFNKRMAEISDSMGRLVEDMVAPNARRIASEIFPSDPVVRIAQRLRQVHPSIPGRMLEMDLLVAGGQHLMVVEAKWRLNPEKVREYLEWVATIPEFLPEYSGHRLVPVVASVALEPSVIAFLNRMKVYGVAMGDETMELVNLGQF